MKPSSELQRTQQVIAAQLAELAPGQLLCVGNSQPPVVTNYAAADASRRLSHYPTSSLPQAAQGQSYNLALFVNCLEHLEKPLAHQLLGTVRNLNASRINVLVDMHACDWTENGFYALAMKKLASFQRPGQTPNLFGYDIFSYKQIPDWLNARFWAHPENFGKYWW